MHKIGLPKTIHALYSTCLFHRFSALSGNLWGEGAGHLLILSRLRVVVRYLALVNLEVGLLCARTLPPVENDHACDLLAHVVFAAAVRVQHRQP